MPNPTHLPKPGHNPGHVRDAFLEAIEDGEPTRMRSTAGKLWSCTDVLPSEYCSLLDIPQGSSYAQAAHAIRV